MADPGQSGATRIDVHVARRDRVVTVTVAGDIDMVSAPKLAHALLSVAEPAQTDTIVVDVAAVGFMDSSGLGALVGALRRGVPVQLRHVSVQLRSMLATTGLTHILPELRER